MDYGDKPAAAKWSLLTPPRWSLFAPPLTDILMDVGDKYPGITHVALRVASLEAAESVLAARGIAITGRMSFKDMRAIFIRDPDRTVIELDAYPGEAPQARENDDDTSDLDGYTDHP